MVSGARFVSTSFGMLTLTPTSSRREHQWLKLSLFPSDEEELMADTDGSNFDTGWCTRRKHVDLETVKTELRHLL